MEKKIILGIKNTYYFFNKGFRCEVAAPDKTLIGIRTSSS